MTITAATSSTEEPPPPPSAPADVKLHPVPDVADVAHVASADGDVTSVALLALTDRIETAAFTHTRRRGYDQAEVDAFLTEIAKALHTINTTGTTGAAGRAGRSHQPAAAPSAAGAAAAARALRTKTFTASPARRGYDADQVHALLNRVAADLDTGWPSDRLDYVAALLEGATFTPAEHHRTTTYAYDDVDTYLEHVVTALRTAAHTGTLTLP